MRQLFQKFGHGGILLEIGNDDGHHLRAEIVAEFASVLTVSDRKQSQCS
jgi:hypothetical protein